MAYNADIATATSMAPQLGTLSTTTTPTLVQGNVIWGMQYNRVRLAFKRAGLSDTPTAASLADVRAEEAEMFLTSGKILLAKGSIGKDAQSTALLLCKQGEEMLQQIVDDQIMLLDNGATADTGTADPRIKSFWLEDKDPQFNESAGIGDREYAQPPTFQDSSDL